MPAASRRWLIERNPGVDAKTVLEVLT